MIAVHELTPDDATLDVEPAIAVERPQLPADMERVVYEVSSWPVLLRSGIVDSLTIAAIAFEWDEDANLIVAADAEARVDEIFDAMPDPDDQDMLDIEGLDAQEVLSAMWQATGTLARNPGQSDAVLSAVESADSMHRMALPFGFEASVWREIVARSVVLRAAFESEDEEDQLSDDELRDECRALHEILRHYI